MSSIDISSSCSSCNNKCELLDNPSSCVSILDIDRVELNTDFETEAGYQHFFEKFLVGNKPCIVTSVEMEEWGAIRDWVTPEGCINFHYLKQTYGEVQVSVTKITDEMNMGYGGMECKDMSVTEYLEYWNKYQEQGYPSSTSCLYLKDWHILKNAGKAKDPPYKVPMYFSSDWLNEASEADDFRFCYMGPKGSWTPFHSDVYGSFSWSANIVGKKKWRLYPPGKEERFRNSSNGESLQYDYDNPGIYGEDYFEVIQHAREIIFVPSGWHHIVWNEEDTISINHNWFNAANICHVWKQLRHALTQVQHEIEDLKAGNEEFNEQCQLILKSNHGMNYADFVDILIKIWNNRRNNKNDVPEPIHFIIHKDIETLKHVISHHLRQDPDLDDTSRKKMEDVLTDDLHGY